MITVGFDIDGTLRNIVDNIGYFLEIDHPDKVDTYLGCFKSEYYALEKAFGDRGQMLSWMYEERPFEIFGKSGRVHPRVIDDLNIFANVAKQNGVQVVIASVQQQRSITATLHWLSKYGCKLDKFAFFPTMQEKIDANFDIYVDDCPMVLNAFCSEQIQHNGLSIYRAIKVPYDFNSSIECPYLDIAGGQFDELYNLLGVEKVLKI